MTSINTLNFFCSGLLVVLLLKLFSHYPILNPLVKNNDGKWHCKKYNRISRDGGTVLFLFLLGICNPISNWYLFITLLIIFFVGLYDDIYPLSISTRIALYLVASFTAMLFAPIFFAFNAYGKTMLGNTGSTLLGFLIGLFCVAAFIQTGNWIKILTCIAYPTLDFLFVVCRRILEGREPWIGGTDHTSHFLALRYGEKWALFYIGLFQLSIGLLGFNYL